MSIVLIFSRSDRIGSRFIRFATWSEWSHVDAVLRDKTLVGSVFDNGVTRYTLAKRIEASTGYGFRAVDGDADKFEEYLLSQIGKPYDVSAIFGLTFRRDWAEDDKWFCSELIAAALTYAGVEVLDKPAGRVTPQDLIESSAIKRMRIV